MVAYRELAGYGLGWFRLELVQAALDVLPVQLGLLVGRENGGAAAPTSEVAHLCHHGPGLPELLHLLICAIQGMVPLLRQPDVYSGLHSYR